MIPLSPDFLANYSAWLDVQHAKSRKHYMAFIHSLQRHFGGAEAVSIDGIDVWIKTVKTASRRTARKCLRKYLAWLETTGHRIPPVPALATEAPAHGIPDDRWNQIAGRKSGPIHHRQLYMMAFLHRTTSLPAAGIGQVTVEGVLLQAPEPHILYKGVTYALPPEVAKALEGWLLIRSRLRSSPEDVRRHRKTEAWAQSPFLFPRANGTPSPYAVIWRLRSTTLNRPLASVASAASAL